MDAKGKTVCIAVIPGINKVIMRDNITHGKNPVKVFGIEFNSWHAEMRVLYTISNNRYFQHHIIDHGTLELTVLRYTKCGNFGLCSKPCDKCQQAIKVFKKKYVPDVRIIVNYYEDSEMKGMVF